ncbi:energy transducer TonB [Edaphocola aurantiacus]|uniref:energy transducer TonB n=1 Tax=Edaphocola aurantiacus TaxID=2601682 RepID=UPI001C944DDD|nr:energy transducer TonB [Edaphocola aurantiacus]
MRTILSCLVLLFGFSMVGSAQSSSAIALHKGIKVMPEFPGGTAALQKYLGNEIRYPAYAREAEIEGKLIIAFVVTRQGTVTNARIIKGKELGHGLPEEALRVIKKMPVWRPALNTKNKPAPFLYFQEVTFRLQ